MTDRHPLDGPDTDWGREITRRQDWVEQRTDERHTENQAATKQLSDDVHEIRSAVDRQVTEMGHFRDEALARWRRVDRNQGIFERFMDDWVGRESEGKVGLGVKVRKMSEQWEQLRWGARIIWATVAMLASAIGYLAARFLESHK